MTALATAEGLIYGEKAAAYGDPVENFDRLAALWAPILGVDVTAQQVTLCLLQLKVSRLIHQPGHEDSIIDAAGYVGCYERVTKERGHPCICNGRSKYRHVRCQQCFPPSTYWICADHPERKLQRDEDCPSCSGIELRGHRIVEPEEPIDWTATAPPPGEPVTIRTYPLTPPE